MQRSLNHCGKPYALIEQLVNKRANPVNLGLLGLQHIAATPDRMDQLFRSTSVDFVPQVVDIDVDDIRKRVEVLIPHVLGNHGSR